MPFIDEIRISANAGRGGNGVVRWLHEKGKEFGGPSGGNGGRGGDVVFKAVRDLNVLSRYKGRSKFKALNGDDGGNKNMFGKAGESVTINVPVGTIVTRQSSGQTFELLRDGDEVVALRGGGGGRGNAEFKSSTNQYPTQATKGGEGESEIFAIELKLIADVGLIGLPNAGKSSLLNALTNAGAKVGDYAFTTLDPNLGAYHGFVIADIPGLIEGASSGKGLGDKFLRHITRTMLLVHCISSEQDDMCEAYQSIRKELESFDTSLLDKEELVLLTKSDLVSASDVVGKIAALFACGVTAMPISILDDADVKKFSDMLIKVLRK